MVEMMDKQPKNKNEQRSKKYQLTFIPVENSLAINTLKKGFKSVVKQSVIHNLPLIISEITKELLKQKSAKSEKNNEN